MEQHLSRSHQEGVSVRVETRGFDHELHDLSFTATGEELESWFGGTTFVGRISVGPIPVHVTTVDETTDDGNSAVTESFSGRIPAGLLHGEKGGVIEPVALGAELGVWTCAWVEDTDSSGTVEVVVSSIEETGTPSGIGNAANVATRTDGSITTQGNEGTVGKMHARCAEHVCGDLHDVRLASGDIINGTHCGMAVDLGGIAFRFVEDVDLLVVTEKQLEGVETGEYGMWEGDRTKKLAIMALTSVSPPSSNDPPFCWDKTAGIAAARPMASAMNWRESIVMVVFCVEIVEYYRVWMSRIRVDVRRRRG